MEPIVNYLEDTEKKLVKEMSELFSKMREQRDTMSLQGIETMYTYKPVEGVLYEPCIRIPCTNPNVKRYLSTLYYCSHYKLPQDEFVVFIKETQDNGSTYSPGATYYCIALTNYGRFIGTFAVVENRMTGGYKTYGPAANNNEIYDASHGQTPSGKNPIIKLDPLPYKLPPWFLQSFITHGEMYNSIGLQDPNIVTQSLNNTTKTLQFLSKEFYLFAGKWQPHMTVYATIEVDTMRQTILENTENIQEISEKNKILEEKNRNLQAELEKLKEQNAALEKEKTKLLPLEKYKETVLEFMENHYIGNEPWDNDDTSDKDIIEYFSNWHNDKVFMDQYEYDDFMNQQEELNEYRIYKKVKGRKGTG
jgi:hypothetical protein